MEDYGYTQQVKTVFKERANMGPNEIEVIDGADALLLAGTMSQFSVKCAAFYLADHYKVLEGLFAPQMYDYDHYLAQKYAIDNALMCVLFSLHESHEIRTCLKEKKSAQVLRELFYRKIEKKMTRWTNVYIAIRNKEDHSYPTQTAILYQMCILKLSRMLVREKKYWFNLLEQMQHVFAERDLLSRLNDFSSLEVRQGVKNFSRPTEFLIDLRKTCVDVAHSPKGVRLTFHQLRAAMQVKLIVRKWSSIIMINDIIWLYQDMFDGRLWHKFKETTQQNRDELKRAIKAYEENIIAKDSQTFKENRGQYYAIFKRRFMAAFEKVYEKNPLFTEYLEILSGFVEADKNAPSPFSKVTRMLKKRGTRIEFSNLAAACDLPPAPKRYKHLLRGECACPCTVSVFFSWLFSLFQDPSARVRECPPWLQAFLLRAGMAPGFWDVAAEKPQAYELLLRAGMFALFYALTLWMHASRCTGIRVSPLQF
ncbi:uncharacterized protein NEMAJ01_0671 [Nematocida major]|uniref:uncharacterized protein n=1 Tax=Nematocida major TaxID=1912982 RepID=UPI002007AD0A|nr:uncharacterized protein NEMAJ01_0671 [Nematocida major]KAH9385775.1 hypothetical protein NEMAJ01_0671 [Nematocida major]